MAIVAIPSDLVSPVGVCVAYAGDAISNTEEPSGQKLDSSW